MMEKWLDDRRRKRASKGDTARNDGKREGGVKSILIQFIRIILHHCRVHKHNHIMTEIKTT
jgi:hypothetical protein